MTDVGLRISTKKYKKTIETFPFQIESSALECTMKFLLPPTSNNLQSDVEFMRYIWVHHEDPVFVCVCQTQT